MERELEHKIFFENDYINKNDMELVQSGENSIRGIY